VSNYLKGIDGQMRSSGTAGNQQ